MKPSSDSTFLQLACGKEVVVNAIKIALVVGTILAAINHGPALLDGSFNVANLTQVLLTYLVPYSVSTWSSVKILRRISTAR